MGYFNYHNTALKLIKQEKLIGFYFTENHNGITPALVLLFEDSKHPVMPIREHKWMEYLKILPKEKLLICPTNP